MESRRGIVCAGNWIVDIVHDIPSWPAKSDLVVISHQSVGVGGGAANVAFGLAALNVEYPVLPAGILGDDVHGEVVLNACHMAKLPIESLKTIPDVSTSHTHVMNVPGDSRTFFYHAGANEHLDAKSLSIDAIFARRPRIFYLGYLNLLPRLDVIKTTGRTEAADLLASARQSDMLTCVDLVSSTNDAYALIVLATLPEIDWLFLNETEASRATGVDINGDTDRESIGLAATQLMAGGLRQGCILHTPKLSLWKTADQEIWSDVPQIPQSEIVSPVGAGDAFAAGVLHGLHEEWSPHECVALGNKMAAACLRAPTATGGIPALNEL
ncbi:MAG: sugar/nucleoside kinase (ribokinase family) [Yoonia sp.]|jgi:sugar/nucleoside kinase (ribokinase family)